MLKVLPILGVSLIACGMGMFFASAARLAPPGSGVIPASMAFVAVAMLGGAVIQVVGSLEGRIRELERRPRNAPEDGDTEAGPS